MNHNTIIGLTNFAETMLQTRLSTDIALSAHVVSSALIAEVMTHADVSLVMNQLAAAVAFDKDAGLAMALQAMAEACEALAGRLPATSMELQGKARKSDAGEAKIYDRLRNRFARRGMNFSAKDGVLTVKLAEAKAKPETPEVSEGGEPEGDAGETLPKTMVPTPEECAAILCALSKSDAGQVAALLVAGGFDFGAVNSTAQALTQVKLQLVG